MSLRFDDPVLYADEVRRLASRGSRASWSTAFELTAPMLAPHAERVGALLASEVPQGSYQFRPLSPRSASIQGKRRTLYRIDPLDAVVWGVLTRVLMSAVEPQLGAHLFSYRKGHSQWSACRAFRRYLRDHVRARPDPRARGVFVLRRDVRRYDENIPVGADSPLWRTLDQLLAGQSHGFRGDISAFLQRAFRPPIQQPDGSARPLERGIATGLPTQTVACNTYLLPLDRALLDVPGGFYARFGDDLLFAHPDLEVAQRVTRLLDEGISSLGLTFHPDKSRAHWLTAAGRPHAQSAFEPASHLAYLGFDVGFGGARLRADKRRALWLSLRRRIGHSDALLGDASPEQRAEVLCGVVRAALDRRAPLSERYAAWLHFDVMSPADLKQLDHHIALHVAERASGLRGVRAFRAFPPRMLRERHGLPSLVASWHAARKHGRRAR